LGNTTQTAYVLFIKVPLGPFSRGQARVSTGKQRREFLIASAGPEATAARIANLKGENRIDVFGR
jgi:hypothetical protein